MMLSQAILKIEARAQRVKLQDEYGKELLPCEKVWKIAAAFPKEATRSWDLLVKDVLCPEGYVKTWLRLIEDFERQQFTMNLEDHLQKIFL
jgi:hypothetical protein